MTRTRLPARPRLRRLAVMLVMTVLGVSGTARVARAQAADSAAVEDSTPKPVPPTVLKRTRAAWFADGRAGLHVGDIVFVRIGERTLSAARKRQDAVDTKQRAMDFGFKGPSGTGPSASLGSANDGRSQNRGDAAREITLTGDISVKVIAVDTVTGIAQVQGTKVVDLDQNKQTILLTALLRPEDISSTNSIDSARLADVSLTQKIDGSLGKSKSGLLSRILGVFWP